MKIRAILSYVLVVSLFVFGVAVFCLLFVALEYFLADYQYERLVALSPSYRHEVEEILFLYKAQTIDIKESAWGKRFALEPGQYCRQYLILGTAPIDIVYDRDGRVVAKFSSFE